MTDIEINSRLAVALSPSWSLRKYNGRVYAGGRMIDYRNHRTMNMLAQQMGVFNLEIRPDQSVRFQHIGLCFEVQAPSISQAIALAYLKAFS